MYKHNERWTQIKQQRQEEVIRLQQAWQQAIADELNAKTASELNAKKLKEEEQNKTEVASSGEAAEGVCSRSTLLSHNVQSVRSKSTVQSPLISPLTPVMVF